MSRGNEGTRTPEGSRPGSGRSAARAIIERRPLRSKYDADMTEPMAASASRPPIESLRRRTGEAVARAWARAIDDGSLPALAAEADAPPVEVERPADPDPRRPRHEPRAQARPPVPPRPARHRPAFSPSRSRPTPRIRPRARRSARSRSPRPASSTSASPTPPSRRWWPRSSAGPTTGAVSPVVDPRHVNVEFVSANPTGPLHIGNARGAFVGDLLCRVLEAGGHRVTREYYFNDFGTQVRNLGASVLAIREGTECPRTATTATTSTTWRASVPPEVLAHAGEPGGDAAWTSRRLGLRAGPGRHRGQPRASRRPLRRLEERGLAPRARAGSSGPSTG